MTPEAQLARDVLAMLDAQKEYFRTRDQDRLRESKDLERKMRQRCKDILSPPAQPQPGLFDEADPFAGTRWAKPKG